MKDNLRRILELSHAQGASTLLAEMQIPPNYGRRYTEAFRASFKDVATTANTELIPFLLEEVALQPEFMQNDGFVQIEFMQKNRIDAYT